ncbi:zinc finger protein 862-like [Haliotis rubra]|uniref:zinc finger protein 862-like n=1 Tax=Haliotis rubra TaxID=36100 RepID=UPI001EE57C6D|nr:zinc finger protein 862-like [Haliotis rubra]
MTSHRIQASLVSWFGNTTAHKPSPAEKTGENNDTENEPLPKKQKVEKRFQSDWLTKYSWLRFDTSLGMTCHVCISETKTNAFTVGCHNYRHSTLVRHMKADDHNSAIQATSLRQNMSTVVSKVLNDKECAVQSAMLNIYWLAKEQIASSKCAALMELCMLHGLSFPKTLGCDSDSMKYTSHCAVDDMQDAIANSFRVSVTNKISASPCISILIDESTDISVTKKLLIYTRSLNSEFDVETNFLANVQIPDGKATTLLETVKKTLQDRSIPMSKIIAVGSDGAAVMTGRKNGFVALLNKESTVPVIGVHCIAHRLALVTSQAAENVPYLKKFQGTLSDIFYFFKKSSVRRERLYALEEVLECENVTYKEIHSVRWFSIYNALEAVFRTWKPLALFLESERVETNNSTAKGILQRISSYKFLLVLHLLMDIIPTMTRLSLQFQKEDIDLAALRPSIDAVIQQLQYLKEENGPALVQFESQCPKGSCEFDGVPITSEAGVEKRFSNVRAAFLQNLMSELECRFPAVATDVVTCMSVLSLRGLSFLSEDARKHWGTEQLQNIIDFYSHREKTFVDAEETLREWAMCKDMVHQQHYPCTSICQLWQILSSRHPDTFPNLFKIAQVAVLLPLQTATVERGFSVQNLIKRSHRNRLSSERLDTLMQLALEPPVRDVSLAPAVTKWRSDKKRKLFC